MKIAAFEVRDDEIELINKYKNIYNIDSIDIYKETLTLDNIHLVEGCYGVTTLGQTKFNKELIDKLIEYKVSSISTRTIGYNHIDIEYAKKNNIRVSNAYYSPNGVSNYTVMLLLMSIRHYKPALYRINVNDYSLGGLLGRELSSLTVGVIGTGKIGCEVIKNLSGFGCKIYAYDKHQNDSVLPYCKYLSLDEIYKECDIITLHVPLLPDTSKMINKESISKMKDGVILINCARGELMNITDIIEGIENEKIGGLALDVFENEAGIYHHNRKTEIIKNKDMAYLRQFPNVIMTQHIAFYTSEAVESMVKCGIESIKSFFMNESYPFELTK